MKVKGGSQYADSEFIDMSKQINFEDNIFILNTRIRMIQDLLILDADPDIFLDKTLTDVDFIDAALGVLLRDLIENTHLIERNGQFYNLYDTEQLFLGVLWDLANGPGTVSVGPYPVLKDKIALMREHALERRKTIEEHISTDETASSEPVVSSDELNGLLQGL
ncbi:hypothetical protein AGMMS49942_26580 [Spirochaetia bacterium]|nr:hypothetical protein AGMMS49942_26580 [Spirochaetia bacterium]